MRVLPILSLAAALSTASPAQQPPAWADLTIPSGVDPARLDSRGKLVTYRDGNTMHVFSAAHREWSSTPASPVAPTRLMNDCALLRDGTTWTAFSAYTGQFATLTVSPAAQLLNPIGQNNDSILLVLDGGTLHAFSCFVGTWNSRAVTGNTGFAVQRHVALLSDGTLLSGMDAYTGQWHDTSASSPPQVLDCDGIAAIAIDATNTRLFAFSGLHRTWQVRTGIAGAQFARGDDWCLFFTANQLLGYSGVTGTFSGIANTGVSAVPTRRDLCALVDTPGGLCVYSAILNAMSPPLASSSATALVGEATALLVDGLQVTGYSAALGTSSTITLDSGAQAVASTVAVAVDNPTGLPHCYSGLRNAWYQPPAGTLPGVPQLTATSILLSATSGAYAFSARSGSFVPLAGSGIALLGNDQSSIGAAWDQSALHAFDARTDTWRSIPRTSTVPPLVQIWRTSLFAIDGTAAHGFGAQNGTWTSTALPEPFANGRANSESSRVVTATHVLGHAPLPITLATAQFPEFRRVQATGTAAHFSIALDGGGLAVLAGGMFAATPAGVAGLGDFWLVSPLASIFVLPLPGEERATYELQVPLAPWLVGMQWAFQSLAIPAAGPPHLGEAVGVYLL